MKKGSKVDRKPHSLMVQLTSRLNPPDLHRAMNPQVVSWSRKSSWYPSIDLNSRNELAGVRIGKSQLYWPALWEDVEQVSGLLGCTPQRMLSILIFVAFFILLCFSGEYSASVQLQLEFQKSGQYKYTILGFCRTFLVWTIKLPAWAFMLAHIASN